MRRIASVKAALTLAVFAIALALLVVSLVLAGDMITRGQAGTVPVIGQLSVAETLVLYPDTGGQPDSNNPISPEAVLSFREVELDAFGSILGGPPRIPLYVFNNAGTDIRLEVVQSGDKDAAPFIEGLFGPRGGDMRPSPRNATRIEMGQIFTADLGMRFTQARGRTGDFSFIINFKAEALTTPPRVKDFLVVDHGQFKNHFLPHSYDTISETGFAVLSGDIMSDYAVIYFEPAWSNYNNLRVNIQTLSEYVRDGGVVVINVAGNITSSHANIDPLGTDYDRSHTHNAEQILLPDHPYITGQGYSGSPLSSADFNGWNTTDHGWLTGYPNEAEAVLQNDHGISWIQYEHGQGTVIVTTLTYGWSSGAGAVGDALKNIIEYSLFLGGGPVNPAAVLGEASRYDIDDLTAGPDTSASESDSTTSNGSDQRTEGAVEVNTTGGTDTVGAAE